ncbi:hypothetical protein SAMN05216501_2931 [Pseudomonas putida]|nr:hypothetical protein SAMN05216501_2931 [Pseudomonas putida]
MLAGALFTGDSGSVISLRQLSIRSDRPLEQVGEHHGGAGGCLASGDSGGIRAGATDGGSELGGVTAQPLASSIGVSSTSISNRSFFMGFYPRLLLRICAPVFFLTCRSLANHFGESVAAVPLR